MSRFLKKLISSYLKRYHQRVHQGFSIGKAYGVNFLLDWNHSIDKKVSVGLYEHEQIILFKNIVAEHKPVVFYDIGAHSGLYSLIAKSSYNDIIINSFEPDMQNLSQLYANLYLNNYSDAVLVHNVALSNATGTAYLNRTDSTSRGTRFISDKTGDIVNAVKFDEMFHSFEGLSLFKIDVEGHELSVIEGAQDYLQNTRCILFIESRNEEFIALNNKMQSLGFSELYPERTDIDHIFTNLENTI